LEEGLLRDCEGVVAQVRVVEVTKGSKKLHGLMFCDNVGALEPNSKAYYSKGCEFFLFYNTAIGRKMLRSSKPKPNIVEKRWLKLLPSNFKLKRSNNWDKHRSRKLVSYQLFGTK
jgi:hypothetical protein